MLVSCFSPENNNVKSKHRDHYLVGNIPYNITEKRFLCKMGSEDYNAALYKLELKPVCKKRILIGKKKEKQKRGIMNRKS